MRAAAKPPPTLFLLKRKGNYSNLRFGWKDSGGVAAALPKNPMDFI